MKSNLVGEKLLNYTIKTLVSSDELFSVYYAEHTVFDRKVHIKALQDHENLQAKGLLKQEVEQKRFWHAQTALVYDLIETTDNLYLITDLPTKNLTLEQHIHRYGVFTEEKTIRILGQLLEIMGAAHQKGLVHPQLNPSQILVENNQIKLVGFENFTQGIISEAQSAYQSPEEKKKGTISSQSNMYSLGKIANFMLTAQPELSKKHIISPKIAESIAVATEKSENARFKNTQEFATALTEEVSLQEIADVHAMKELPLYVFLGLLGFFIVLLFYIGNDQDVKGNLVYNLYDESRIRRNLDSVRQVRRSEFVRDSMRIVANKAENMQKIHIYKVQKGDNLKEIAEKFNMSASHIKQLNGFGEKNGLRADMGLRVVIRENHKVLDKEELWQIAKKFGITKFEILRANDIAPADEVDEFYPGKDLIIPIKK